MSEAKDFDLDTKISGMVANTKGLPRKYVTLVRELKSPEIQKISKALACWQFFDYLRLNLKYIADKAIEKHNMSPDYVRDKVDQAIKEEILLELLTSNNSHVWTVCMTELMPTETFRRWLRWQNVDFQTREGYLYRMKDSQVASLTEHYTMLGTGKEKDLPCNSQGFGNKVWNFLDPKITAPAKFAKTKAIAHDFLGLGLGFPLYPNEDSDEKIVGSAAKQLMANDPEKGFEVNQDYLGWYKQLYKKLRSNNIWNTGTGVKLGAYICPGFWITLISWFVFLFSAPVFLTAAAFSYGAYAVTFFLLGLVSPMLVLISTWLHMWNKTSYNKKFWDNLGAGVFAMIVAVVFTFFATWHITYTWWVSTLWLSFIVTAVTLFHPDKEVNWPYQLPGIGKYLPYVFVLTVGWDIYQILTSHPEIAEPLTAFMLWFKGLIVAFGTYLLPPIAIFIVTYLVMSFSYDWAKTDSDSLQKMSLKRNIFYKVGTLVAATSTYMTYKLYSVSGLGAGQYDHATILSVAFAFPLFVYFGFSLLVKQIVEPYEAVLTDRFGTSNYELLRALRKNKKVFFPNGSKGDLEEFDHLVVNYTRLGKAGVDFLSKARSLKILKYVLQKILKDPTDKLGGKDLSRYIWLSDDYFGTNYRDKLAQGWTFEMIAVLLRQDERCKTEWVTVNGIDILQIKKEEKVVVTPLNFSGGLDYYPIAKFPTRKLINLDKVDEALEVTLKVIGLTSIICLNFLLRPVKWLWSKVQDVWSLFVLLASRCPKTPDQFPGLAK